MHQSRNEDSGPRLVLKIKNPHKLLIYKDLKRLIAKSEGVFQTYNYLTITALYQFR